MHSEDDLNFQRGYEWWMMTEAKRVRIYLHIYKKMYMKNKLFRLMLMLMLIK